MYMQKSKGVPLTFAFPVRVVIPGRVFVDTERQLRHLIYDRTHSLASPVPVGLVGLMLLRGPGGEPVLLEFHPGSLGTHAPLHLFITGKLFSP